MTAWRTPWRDPLVDERGAERRLDVGRSHRAMTIRRAGAAGSVPGRVAGRGRGMMVEIWSDVVCPWCYIGKRRFERGARRRSPTTGVRPDVEVVYRPFQLDPTAPPGTTSRWSRPTPGSSAGRSGRAAIIDHVTAIAAAEGLEFHLDGRCGRTPVDAHRLLWYAARPADRRRPGRAQGAAAARVLHRRRATSATPRCSSRCAADVGLDADAARRVPRRRRRRRRGRAPSACSAAEAGITAVPTYVIDGRGRSPGRRTRHVFVQVLRRVAADATRAD